MSDPRFDSARAVRIDVARGTVTSSLDERLVFVGASVLQRLVDAAHGDVLEALGQSLGAPIGQRIAVRFGGVTNVRRATFARVVEHLRGEVAVAGLGSLAVERVGRALVVTIARPVVPRPEFWASLVSSALEEVTGRSVRCVPLRGGAGPRLLVVGAGAEGDVRGWLAEGLDGREVIARLSERRGGGDDDDGRRSPS